MLPRAEQHPFPAPSGRSGRAPSWALDRVDEIREWNVNRPGQGVGGGRPRVVSPTEQPSTGPSSPGSRCRRFPHAGATERSESASRHSAPLRYHPRCGCRSTARRCLDLDTTAGPIAASGRRDGHTTGPGDSAVPHPAAATANALLAGTSSVIQAARPVVHRRLRPQRCSGRAAGPFPGCVPAPGPPLAPDAVADERRTSAAPRTLSAPCGHCRLRRGGGGDQAPEATATSGPGGRWPVVIPRARPGHRAPAGPDRIPPRPVISSKIGVSL